MSTHTKQCINSDSGSALVAALVVLTILAALGIAALDVADMNILISANDRDTKNAFFHADSGAGMAVLIIDGILETRELFMQDDSRNGTQWRNQTTFNRDDFDLFTNPFYAQNNGTIGTYGRAGWLDIDHLRGTSIEENTSFFVDYILRSDRQGERNSHAIVDLGWRDVVRKQN